MTARQQLILSMWLDGRSMKAIAAALDTSKAAIGVSIQRMRAKGIHVPYRHQPFSPAHPGSAVPEKRGHYLCWACDEQKPHIAFPFPIRTRLCFECGAKRQKTSRLSPRSSGDRSSPKDKARQTLSYAVRTGRITKPDSCQACGTACEGNGPAGLHGHHSDYSRPLDVEWLCPRCHRAEHRRLDFITTNNNGAAACQRSAPPAKESGSNASIHQ